jgi:hypothetical protein
MTDFNKRFFEESRCTSQATVRRVARYRTIIQDSLVLPLQNRLIKKDFRELYINRR